MTEVLLIQPPLPEKLVPYRRDVVLCPPIGLCYIASTLLSHGFDVDIVDLAISDQAPERAELEISRAKPRVLGITTPTCTYEKAIKIARKAKEIDPEIVTVLGGPHVTFAASEALAHPQIDLVVKNEGEITMVELCKLYVRGEGSLGRVKGVAYRNEGRVVNSVGRPLIQDLDKLPFPARQLLPLDLYKIPGTLITSRGCPSQCIFCAARAMSGGTYRTRSPSNVLSEVDEMERRFDPPFYFIADDTFTVYHDRTRKICAGLKEMGLRWFCESKANSVNKDLLSTMADAGCYAIQFGVESGSQTILNSIRKGVTIDQVRNAAKWARELNLLTVCSFMVPLPEDTLDTIAETKRLMLELKSQGVVIFVSPTTPFPGTYIWDHATELGVRMVSDNLEDYDLATPIIETRHLNIKQVSSAYEDLVSICPEIPDVRPLT